VVEVPATLNGTATDHHHYYYNIPEAQKKCISLAGNRTPASCELFFRMTSRNTDHYTTKEVIDLMKELVSKNNISTFVELLH
jgi:hypothetical protein